MHTYSITLGEFKVHGLDYIACNSDGCSFTYYTYIYMQKEIYWDIYRYVNRYI